ncbi:hypothetical protein BC629DRAFT_769501 [Irpex lacteus]|nr:hypothetical protein BC629DRAFT_769501 [Irpex lacteus]
MVHLLGGKKLDRFNAEGLTGTFVGSPNLVMPSTFWRSIRGYVSSTTELLNFFAPLFVEIRDGPPFSDSEKSQRHEDTVAHRPRITFSHYALTCGLSALPAGCPYWASYSHTETAYLTQERCGLLVSFLSKAFKDYEASPARRLYALRPCTACGRLLEQCQSAGTNTRYRWTDRRARM